MWMRSKWIWYEKPYNERKDWGIRNEVEYVYSEVYLAEKSVSSSVSHSIWYIILLIHSKSLAKENLSYTCFLL